MAEFLRGSRSAQLALNIDVSLQEEIWSKRLNRRSRHQTVVSSPVNLHRLLLLTTVINPHWNRKSTEIIWLTQSIHGSSGSSPEFHWKVTVVSETSTSGARWVERRALGRHAKDESSPDCNCEAWECHGMPVAAHCGLQLLTYTVPGWAMGASSQSLEYENCQSVWDSRSSGWQGCASHIATTGCRFRLRL